MQKPVMKAAPTLSAADFFARVRERLTLETPTGLNDPNIVPKRGDHDVDPIMEKIALVRPIRPAAVLIPVVEHAEPTVLLTQRAQHLPDHPGQVSFPGGKIDKSDKDPMHSALREAEEEIGLDRAHIDGACIGLDSTFCWLGKEPAIEVERQNPSEMSTECCQEKQDRQGADYREEDNIVDHHTSLLKGLHLAHDARDPISGVLFE